MSRSRRSAVGFRRLLPGVVLALVAAACSQVAGPDTAVTTTLGDPAAVRCGEPFASEHSELATGEISGVIGLATSRSHDGVSWFIGDVRGELRLWAVRRDGGDPLGSVTLPAEIEEVVDLAIGPGRTADQDFMYLVLEDTDLAAEVLTVLRFEEPDPAGPALEDEPTVLRFSASGQRPQASALMVDGETGDLYVIATGRRRSILFRGQAPLAEGGVGDLVAVAGVGTTVTDADISPNGRVIAVTTPFDVAIWQRPPGETVAGAVASAPCIAQVAGGDLTGATGLTAGGDELTIVQSGLQPAITSYTIPALDGLDETRAGSVAPEVAIVEPPPGLTITDGFPLEIAAAVVDDAPVQPRDVRWRLESRQCTAEGACEVSEVAIESGNPISVAPSGAELAGSEYAITVTYTDEFELTATETMTFPFRLPEPVPGSAAEFLSGSVEVGDIPGLADDMTLEMWLRPEDLSVRRVVLGKAYSGEGLIIHEEDGRLNYFHGESGGNCCDGTYLRFGSVTILPSGEWSHVVITRDVSGSGGLLRFYIDGEQTNSQTITKSPSESSLPWIIGNGYRAGFVGGIDEVAIYDRVLSRAEIENHYDAIGDPAEYGQLVLEAGPVGYWRLDEPAGALARDEIGEWNGRYVGDVLQGQPGAIAP